MRTILLIVFLSPILFSQSITYPDSVYMKSGKNYPCLVTQLTDKHVHIIYLDNFDVSSTLVSVDKLKISDKGVVYENDKFLQDFNSVKDFISERFEAIQARRALEEKEENQRQAAEAAARKLEQDKNKITPLTTRAVNEIYSQPSIANNERKLFSFGVIYIPYYSGVLYNGMQDNTLYPPSFYKISENITMMEGQFAFFASPRFAFTLNTGYRTYYSKERVEIHDGNEIPQYANSGSEIINDIKIWDFTIGVKYYFTQLFDQKSRAFVLAGVGKQIASAEFKNENLFIPPGNYEYESNVNDYLKKLNSPLHFTIGFGAEYYFNDALSLFSNIKISYSRITGDFKSRYFTVNYPEYDRTITKEIESSSTSTQVGLGLNFYF